MLFPNGYIKHDGIIKCEICDKYISIEKFANHPIMAHKIKIKDYYDKYLKKNNEGICICGNKTKFWGLVNGYRQFCSIQCLTKNISVVFDRGNISHDTYKCQICNKGFRTINCLSKHIVIVHKINSKNYYDQYLKKENDGLCKMCNKPTKYYDMRKGYNKYCSNHCGSLDPEVQNKNKMTNIKKYGVDFWTKTQQGKMNSRIHTIKRIETQKLNGEPLTPAIGYIERLCLNELQTYTEFKIIRNDHDIAYSTNNGCGVGRFPDGHIKEIKLFIQFDEYIHFKDGKKCTILKDDDVQCTKDLESIEGYKVLRISQKDWEENKEGIIEKFKFICLNNSGEKG